jgi:hypothetical protein
MNDVTTGYVAEMIVLVLYSTLKNSDKILTNATNQPTKDTRHIMWQRPMFKNRLEALHKPGIGILSGRNAPHHAAKPFSLPHKAGTGSSRYPRHHLLAETRHDTRRMK